MRPGAATGAGSQGDLGADLLAVLRCLSAHASQPWLAGTPLGVAGYRRIGGDHHLLHRCQSSWCWPAQLRMVPQLLIRASCLLVLASQAGLAGQRISLQDYGRTCRSEARQAGAPGFWWTPAAAVWNNDCWPRACSGTIGFQLTTAGCSASPRPIGRTASSRPSAPSDGTTPVRGSTAGQWRCSLAHPIGQQQDRATGAGCGAQCEEDRQRGLLPAGSGCGLGWRQAATGSGRRLLRRSRMAVL